MPQREKQGSGNLIPVAGILAASAAALLILWAPFVECPACEGKAIITLTITDSKDRLVGSATAACASCKAGRVSLFKRRTIPPIEKVLRSTDPDPPEESR